MEAIMAILARIFQLFKADIHGVMDQIEDPGLLLKQHLRDMEASLVQKDARLRQMCFARDRAQRDYETGMIKSNQLEQDLEVSIQKDRDDIARVLIKKLKPLKRIQSERRSHIDRLNHEIGRFRENVEQQRRQYEQLRQEAADFLQRTERQGGYDSGSAMTADFCICDISAEEVELELLQRKEALKGGAA
jgi:phage shock protein A